MPRGTFGQQITFSIEQDADQSFSDWVWVTAQKGQTCRSIAAKRGHPELGAQIAKLNKIRSEWFKFTKHRRLRVPGIMKAGEKFDVLCDNPKPIVTDGYALIEVIAVQGRIGVAKFDGYNPIQMQLAIRFLADDATDGSAVERDINLFERMCGRGNFPGAGIGPPPVIRVSTTNNKGNVVPCIPMNYQWSVNNQHAPLWRIKGDSVSWDSGSTSDSQHRRVDAKCTVTVIQYTPLIFAIVDRSATVRSKKRNAGKKKK